ncbi:MAG: hypothetical protein AAF289_16940 [Cyanobacteria bacterium P01_A01_bin.135]
MMRVRFPPPALRQQELEAIAEKVEACGSQMFVFGHTQKAREYAAEQGWIA